MSQVRWGEIQNLCSEEFISDDALRFWFLFVNILVLNLNYVASKAS